MDLGKCKKVWYVDIGDMPKNEVVRYVKKMMRKYKKEKNNSKL
jgi:hypothetical protein